MTNVRVERVNPSVSVREYLIVDEFMRTVVEARALSSALEIGLIDALVASPSATITERAALLEMDDRGLNLLLGLLVANGVAERAGDRFTITERFERALGFRDIMEAKLAFASLVAPDFLELFTALLVDPERFFAEARLFRLFDYNKSLEASAEAQEATRRWVRFTTALTKYESPVCFEIHDFTRYRTWMDIGGNSGEFALQGCARHRELRAMVVDLPGVCKIGREHVRRDPAGERVAFHSANALADSLPGGFDLVSFKSVLHDWPREQARQFLRQAWLSLDPGGTVLIYERGEIAVGAGGLPYSIIPMLLFFRYFHTPAYYAEMLADVGFVDCSVVEFELETPFFLVTATRPG